MFIKAFSVWFGPSITLINILRYTVKIFNFAKKYLKLKNV